MVIVHIAHDTVPYSLRTLEEVVYHSSLQKPSYLSIFEDHGTRDE